MFVEEHRSPVLDTSDVHVARTLLHGAHVTLLGGHPTHGQRTALMDAFQLATLDWIGVDEYTHGLHADSRIHPETALVILAVRWMAHAHHGLRDVAKRRAVPVMMHPGGLNPRSVAYQVVRQASEQLRQRV
ncbi:hypothetical protein GCM10008957_48010 [Deinococcus ruber]|uniref:DUF2325 domain-containing protein n=1 Tax=Deinococcus ruber TaxID=1848197 RepID=A0A918CPD0_9DEIO|nr:hypothetical protein GCM10008957_48010 [Deinococcus ruber]